MMTLAIIELFCPRLAHTTGDMWLLQYIYILTCCITQVIYVLHANPKVTTGYPILQ